MSRVRVSVRQGFASAMLQRLEQHHVRVGRQVPRSTPLVEAGGDGVLGGDVHARRGPSVLEVSVQVVEQVTAPRAFNLKGQRRGDRWLWRRLARAPEAVAAWAPSGPVSPLGAPG